MLKVLITGASGYLARNCVRELIKSNVDLILYSFSKTKVIAEQEGIFYCDDIEQLKSLSIDIVIHSGWAGVDNDERINEKLQFENFNFTRTLLENLNLESLKGFLFFGSQSEYGNIFNQIKEEEQTNPNTFYALYKDLSGRYIDFMSRAHSFNFYHFRIFAIYGGDQSGNWLIPNLIRNIKLDNTLELTNPRKKISFLHIKDFVKIISHITLNPIPSGIYNICGSEIITLEDLLFKITELIPNCNPQIKKKHQSNEKHIIGNNKKLMSYIKLENLISLDEGLKQELIQ
jgi:nucleoside-diphosphate-sugar epimerase